MSRRMFTPGSKQDPTKNGRGYTPESSYQVRGTRADGKALPKPIRAYRPATAQPTGRSKEAQILQCAVEVLDSCHLNDPAHCAALGYNNPRSLALDLGCDGIAMEYQKQIACAGDVDMRWTKEEWSWMCAAIHEGEWHIEDIDGDKMLVVEVA